MSTSPTLNGATTVLTAIMTLKDAITSNGQVVITFPLQNYYYSALGNGGVSLGVGATAYTTMVSSSSTATCLYTTTGGATITIPCTGTATSSVYKIVLTSSTVGGLTSGIVPALGTLTVTVTAVTNPPSTRQFTTFQMYTADSSGNEINIQTGISLSVTTVAQFDPTSSSAAITTSNGVLVTGSTYSFQLGTTNPIPIGGYIQMVVPSSVGVPGALSLVCGFGCSGTIAPAYNAGGWYDLKGIVTNYIDDGSFVIFTVSGFTNPSSTTPAAFTFTSRDTSGSLDNAIDTISSLTVTAVMGVITFVYFKPADIYKIYDTPSSYMVSLTIQHAVDPTYQLILTLPTDFQVLAGSCSITGLNSGYTCTASSTANTITISNFVAVLGQASTTYSFNVTNIKNPGTYSQTGTITAQLAISTGGVIDQGTTTVAANTYVSTTIESFTVVPSSYLAGAAGVTYTFTVRPRARVNQGLYLKVKLPSDISIPSPSSIEISCGSTLSGFSSSHIYCLVSSDKTTLSIQNGFSSSSSSGNPPTLVFSVPAITNPRSTQTTAPFNISILDSNDNGYYYYNYTTTPTVTMTGATSPMYMVYNRTNPQNGAYTQYDWVIRVNDYYNNGDIMYFTVPSSSSIQFSSSTKCIGTSRLVSGLSCTVSSDLSYVSVIVQYSRRRILTISSGDTITLSLTNVLNPPTFRPTTNSFQYTVKTSSGYLMESKTTGLTVTNSIAGALSILTTGVLPQSFGYGSLTNYSVSFVPTNYEQGMKIIITIPSQVGIPNNTNIGCYGITGTDTPKLACTNSTSIRTVTITNAVSNQKSQPYNITILLGPFINPSDKIVTDSFKISTFTSDNYAIDLLSSNLTVNFYCNYPCKTCDNTKTTYCYSCYSAVPESLFYNNLCITQCPLTTYELVSNNSCSACAYPCAYCSNNATTCTKCVSGFTLVGNSCYQISFYPWPFVALGFLLVLFTLLCILCRKETKFRESAIALVAWPELFSWIAYTLMQWYFSGFTLHFYLAAGAIVAHIFMNVVYTIIHQKVIVPQHSSQAYKNFVNTNHKCLVLVLLVSFLCTFKFHHLTISWMGNSKKLKGKLSPRSWQDWNAIAFTYIVISYGPMMASCALYIYSNHKTFGSVLQYLTCEVLFLSTFVTFLLLVGMCATCSCCKSRKAKAEQYNQVKGDQSSMLDSSSSSTLVRKKNVHKKVYNEDLIEDIEINNKKRHRVVKTQDPDFSDEEDYMYGKNQRKETDIDKRSSRRHQKAYNDEIDLLHKLTEQLKNEEHLMNMEKKMILQERERLLREREDRFFELETIKTELGRDKASIKKERQKLNDQRDDFLNEVDRRIQQKLEDWEQQSMRSSSTLNKKLRLGHAPNDKLIQTNKRMHEVDFNVGCGSEDIDETYKRCGITRQPPKPHKQYQVSPTGFNRPIKEEAYESDDIDQQLNQADEVIRYQQEQMRPVVKGPALPKPFNERNQDKITRDDNTQIQLNHPKQVYERVLNDKIRHDHQQIQINLPKPANESDEIAITREHETHQMINLPNHYNERDEITVTRDYQIQEISNLPEPVYEKDEGIITRNHQTHEMINVPNSVVDKVEQDKHQKERFENKEYNIEKIIDVPSAHYRDEFAKVRIERTLVTDKPITPNTGFYCDEDEFEREEAEQYMESRGKLPSAQMLQRGDTQLIEKEVITTHIEYVPNPHFGRDDQGPIIKEEWIEAHLELVEPHQDRTAGKGFRQAEQWIEDRSVLPPPHFTPRVTNHGRFRDATGQEFFEHGQAESGQVSEDERFKEADIAYMQKHNPQLGYAGQSQMYHRENEEAFVQIPDDENAHGRAATHQHQRTKEHQQSYIHDHQQPHGGTLSYNKEEFEEMKTQLAGNESLDEISMSEHPKEIEAEDLDQNRDFAKKQKKKVIYSDKSESSIDEMMEDTPSNYNIPNGRLDGKSQGIKGILQHAQKQKQNNTLALSPRNRFEPPPKSNTHNNNTPKDGNLLMAQHRLGQQQKLHPDDEKKFVNNLFRETPVPGQMNQKPIIGGAGGKHLKMPAQQNQNRNQSLQKQHYAQNSALDSGNEQSWRAFNQPLRNMEVLDDTMMTINDQTYNQHDISSSDQMENNKQKKKKKKIAPNKQFKEPNPNLERIKALESAYMMKQPGQIATGNPYQRQGSKVAQGTPQQQSMLPRLRQDEGSTDNNNFESERQYNHDNRGGSINKKTNNYF